MITFSSSSSSSSAGDDIGVGAGSGALGVMVVQTSVLPFLQDIVPMYPSSYKILFLLIFINFSHRCLLTHQK